MSDSHWLVTGFAFFVAAVALHGEPRTAAWFAIAFGIFAIGVSVFFADKDGDR